jgi:N-acyl-L-homoserine lactone synthetase
MPRNNVIDEQNAIDSARRTGPDEVSIVVDVKMAQLMSTAMWRYSVLLRAIEPEQVQTVALHAQAIDRAITLKLCNPER